MNLSARLVAMSEAAAVRTWPGNLAEAKEDFQYADAEGDE